MLLRGSMRIILLLYMIYLYTNRNNRKNIKIQKRNLVRLEFTLCLFLTKLLTHYCFNSRRTRSRLIGIPLFHCTTQFYFLFNKSRCYIRIQTTPLSFRFGSQIYVKLILCISQQKIKIILIIFCLVSEC